jgi:hypothetical protein
MVMINIKAILIVLLYIMKSEELIETNNKYSNLDIHKWISELKYLELNKKNHCRIYCD